LDRAAALIDHGAQTSCAEPLDETVPWLVG
jgi:hypothetical protein